MFQKRFVALMQWVVRYQTILTAGVGSVIVAIWTVLRHITNGINFDVVGQIGVAAQWTHGLHDGAIFGATNYLIKMPLYMIVNAVHALPPATRLLVLALLCSVGAYLLIYLLLRKIVRLYGIQDFTLLNLGMLWLATIAGRVFWVDYANSRNLEVAGGLVVLYLILRGIERGVSWRSAIALSAVSAVVFFADPLQLYTIGAGMGLACVVLAVRNKSDKRRPAILIGGALVVGAVLSRALLWLSSAILPVSYLSPPKTVLAVGISTLTSLFQNTLTSTLRIFDINVFSKALSVNSLRQIGGIALLTAALYVLIRYRSSPPKLAARLLCWLIVWNYAVYIASGNAGTAITERYIILVPILVVLLLGIYGGVMKQTQIRWFAGLWLTTVALSATLLFGAVILQWPHRYTLDQPMFAVATFTESHSYDFVIASRVLAVPGNYYAGYDKTIVPIVCNDNVHIATSNLFYDQAAYSSVLGRTKGVVAVLVPAEGISSYPFHCSSESILSQLGRPNRVISDPSVGTVYEYSADTPSLRGL